MRFCRKKFFSVFACPCFYQLKRCEEAEDHITWSPLPPTCKVPGKRIPVDFSVMEESAPPLSLRTDVLYREAIPSDEGRECMVLGTPAEANATHSSAMLVRSIFVDFA